MQRWDDVTSTTGGAVVRDSCASNEPGTRAGATTGTTKPILRRLVAILPATIESRSLNDVPEILTTATVLSDGENRMGHFYPIPEGRVEEPKNAATVPKPSILIRWRGSSTPTPCRSAAHVLISSRTGVRRRQLDGGQSPVEAASSGSFLLPVDTRLIAIFVGW